MKSELTRRQFIASTMAAATAAPAATKLLAADAPASTPAGARRPNVIVIMLDDLGSVDANCYGARDLVTPSLDALAASGTRFTQLCSAAPVCSPSRAAVLTGRFPQRAGLATNASSQYGRGEALGADEVTIARMLKDAGYVTAHVGKWHLGYTQATMPLAKGFDQSFGHMGGCIDNYSHFFYWEGPNRHDLWEDGKEVWREGQNIGDLMVERCNAFLEGSGEKPFLLFWAINQPHYPLQGSARWRSYYSHLPSPRSMYAASVSTLDDLIGRVMAKLRALGLADNTIVVLQSDHGHSTEERTFGGGGSAGPYRGAKFSLFEGGIRVVSMISWPGTLPQGAVRHQLVSGCDWLPTIADLTGAALPPRRIDGKSMLPVIRSADAPTQHPVLHWQLAKQWAVREGPWKLIGNPRDTSEKGPLTDADKLFLSNLDEDISEMRNLAPQHPSIVARLSALHDSWVEDVQDRS